MPHVCRLDPPGSLHHVMSHCVEGCRAFLDERFKQDMIDRLSLIVGKNLLRIHAWALMDNHFHLLAEPVEATLSVAMQKLLTGFACAYNRRSDRRGHVFDARFRSILVEREGYYLKLLAYIHLNPLKAGIVATLEALSSYPWTGHSAITGACSRPWMSQEMTRALLSGSGRDWRSEYQGLFASSQGIDEEELDSGNFSIGRAGLKEVTGEGVDSTGRSIRVLGSKGFALSQYEQYRDVRRIGIRNRREQHREMKEALTRVASECGILPSMLRSGSRARRLVDARQKLLEELLRISGVTQADAAAFLNITEAAVSLIRKQHFGRR